MKNKISLLLVTICCIAVSCEQKNTESETQSLQHHDDSLRAAIEAEANGNLQRQNDSLKNAFTNHVTNNPATTKQTTSGNSSSSQLGNETNALVDAKLQLARLNTLVVNIKAKLEFETNELNRVEQYHIGRLKSEREQQIRQQSIRVQTYQNLLQKTQDAIISVGNKINTLQNNISSTN